MWQGMHLQLPIVSTLTIIILQGQDADTLGEIIRDRLGGQVLRAFSTSVFCGVSVEALHVNLDSFLALGVVSNVWHSKQLELGPISPEMPTSQGANVSNYTIHHMTNVDRLHREGIFGKGVRVAVIDTGIDYNHSAVSIPRPASPDAFADAWHSLVAGLDPASRLLEATTWWAMLVRPSTGPESDLQR
jgi:hypothetical protein